ncbi:hypothetical protein F1721_22195 [Saccharopolyspora hirsuta]|uniref:WXG100 family type VII secretion target n=1 Tax=Saccharopolyspora hirsuta TaxID=1837 RepID=A0A5M7BMN5_SACHI|nr:WXG100 family type VII secretion target [Saccharopolyspora hirsuta]KAA5830573.1 hypothetical protein F1721_22195 [Saccharopolyspora hirsuta]
MSTPQGVVVDRAVMSKAASDFDDTATRIREMMAKLNAEVEGLVGATQNFNGSARLAFDQNKMLLNDKIQRAQNELTVIATKFNEVMNQHAGFSEQQSAQINQTTAALHSGGGIIAGLNG